MRQLPPNPRHSRPPPGRASRPVAAAREDERQRVLTALLEVVKADLDDADKMIEVVRDRADNFSGRDLPSLIPHLMREHREFMRSRPRHEQHGRLVAGWFYNAKNLSRGNRVAI